MTKHHRTSFSDLAIQQGATVLIQAMVTFLRENNISKKMILGFVRSHNNARRSQKELETTGS